MEQNDIDKILKIREQRDKFVQDTAVQKARLGDLKEEYGMLLERLKRETNSQNLQEALARIKELESQLISTAESLRGIFGEFEKLSEAE